MSEPIVRTTFFLGFPWTTFDPFLFCVHHQDFYPEGNEAMGPAASLAGRSLGMDFEIKDGWRMYHGRQVPGFPQHPHRGFETVTLARSGFIDHSDSLGATARFGHGDVQWMTAGRGVVHSEMFPLVHRDAPNPCELLQLWLNLPAADKMVDPHFAMLWADRIPRLTFADERWPYDLVTVIAGALGDATPASPPPELWAFRGDTDVAIWTLKMSPGATWRLPAAQPESNRTLYFFRGATLDIGDHRLDGTQGARLRPDAAVTLTNGADEAEVLLLQGRPIAEPVAHHGPFVMNTVGEIRQAMLDYHETGFGGWPWPGDAPVHPREAGRFAVHADGREERAD